jgi:hypothetical protein
VGAVAPRAPRPAAGTDPSAVRISTASDGVAPTAAIVVPLAVAPRSDSP